jgi:transposase InsO family protein
MGEGALQLNDLHSDPCHLGTSHAMYRAQGFFAAAPIVSRDSAFWGVLALHAPSGHQRTPEETALLGQRAKALPAQVHTLVSQANKAHSGETASDTGWLDHTSLAGAPE